MTVYEGIHCRLAIEQPAPGVVVLRIAGGDVGEFGSAPMLELERTTAAGETVQLLIDARRAKGATIDVSNDWALWLRANRERFAHARIYRRAGLRSAAQRGFRSRRRTPAASSRDRSVTIGT